MLAAAAASMVWRQLQLQAMQQRHRVKQHLNFTQRKKRHLSSPEEGGRHPFTFPTGKVGWREPTGNGTKVPWG